MSLNRFIPADGKNDAQLKQTDKIYGRKIGDAKSLTRENKTKQKQRGRRRGKKGIYFFVYFFVPIFVPLLIINWRSSWAERRTGRKKKEKEREREKWSIPFRFQVSLPQDSNELSPELVLVFGFVFLKKRRCQISPRLPPSSLHLSAPPPAPPRKQTFCDSFFSFLSDLKGEEKKNLPLIIFYFLTDI